MDESTSDRCRSCITTLTSSISIISSTGNEHSREHFERVSDELARFSLWAGNIGALHKPDSPMSLESRLQEAKDVLTHIQELLDNISEVARECKSPV
jgi:hypothetical protein